MLENQGSISIEATMKSTGEALDNLTEEISKAVSVKEVEKKEVNKPDKVSRKELDAIQLI